MEKHNRDGGKAKNTTKKMQKKKKDRKPNTKLIADDVLAHYAAALAGTSTSGKAVEKSKRKGKQQGFAPTLSDGGGAMATTANSAVHKASASDTAAGSGSGSAKSIDPRDAAIASLFSGTSVFAAAAVSKTAPAARESGDAVRRRKQPAEVVVFNDPSANLLRQSSLEKKAKRMFMSADPGKVYANQDLQVVPGMDGTTGDGDDDSDDAANDLDLRKTAQEILRLSAETMESNARRRWVCASCRSIVVLCLCFLLSLHVSVNDHVQHHASSLDPFPVWPFLAIEFKSESLCCFSFPSVPPVVCRVVCIVYCCSQHNQTIWISLLKPTFVVVCVVLL